MISSKVFWQPARKSPTANSRQQLKILKRNHRRINQNQNQVESKIELNRLRLYLVLMVLVVSQKKLIHS